MRRLWRGHVLVVLLAVAAGAVGAGALAPLPARAATASAYVPLDHPGRLLDTRSGQPATGDGARLTIAPGGRFGVPSSGVTAVALNVTVTGTTAPGYVQVSPPGSAAGATSNLNVERAGQTVAAMVVAPLGAGGATEVLTERRSDVIVDVVGYFAPADRPRRGRILAVPATRLVDTRATRDPLRAGQVRSVAVAGRADVPAGALAVVANVTAVRASAPGFLEAVPAGADLGATSTLNLDEAGQTRANLAVVRLGPGGAFTVAASTDTDLLVDVVGYVTGDSAPASSEGTFVALTPRRVLDTRSGPPLPRGATVTATVPGVPAGAATAVLATVTATSAGVGFLSTSPAPGPATGTSTLNTNHPGATVANAAVVRVSSTGLAVTTDAGGHVLVDVAGYLQGAPAPSTASFDDAWAFWGYLWGDGRYAGGQWTWNQSPYPFAASATRFQRGAAAHGVGVSRSGDAYRTTGSLPADVPDPALVSNAAVAAFLAAVVEGEGSACTGLIEDDPDRSRIERTASWLTRLGVANHIEGRSGDWRVVAERSSWPIVASWPYATTARTPGVGSVCP